MRETLGYLLLIFTLVSLIVIYLLIFKNKTYHKDFLGLIVDSWEVIALALALILVSSVLIV